MNDRDLQDFLALVRRMYPVYSDSDQRPGGKLGALNNYIYGKVGSGVKDLDNKMTAWYKAYNDDWQKQLEMAAEFERMQLMDSRLPKRLVEY